MREAPVEQGQAQEKGLEEEGGHGAGRGCFEETSLAQGLKG